MNTNTAAGGRASRSAGTAGTGRAKDGERALRPVRRTQLAAGPTVGKREPGLSHEEQELRIRERDLAAIAQARADVERLREQHSPPAQPASELSDWQLEIWQDVIRFCNDEEVTHG